MRRCVVVSTLNRLLILALVTVAALGCDGGAEGDACVSTHQCKQGLKCVSYSGGPTYGGSGVCRDLVAQLKELKKSRSDERCQLDESLCRWHGRCRSRGGKCIAGSDADCIKSVVCKKRGWCTARGGRCVK